MAERGDGVEIMATKKQIVNAVLKGIQEAQKDYSRMAGEWVWEGSEYWITVYVARKLWKLVGDERVTVEGSSDQAMESAGRSRGRPRPGTINKRFDIVLWTAAGIAKAPIEIKNQRSPEAVIEDVEKVIAALKGSNMRFGIAGYFYSRTRGERETATALVENYIRNRLQYEAEEGIRLSHRSSPIFGDEDNAWVAGCFLIEKR